METKNIKCGCCGGKGKIDSFKNYANGVCFDCDGSGLEDSFIAKCEARGVDYKPHIVNSYTYACRDGSLRSFYIRPNESAASLADKRLEARKVIAAGALLVETVEMF